MLLGKERFISKGAIAVNLDSCTTRQLVGETQRLYSILPVQFDACDTSQS